MESKNNPWVVAVAFMVDEIEEEKIYGPFKTKDDANLFAVKMQQMANIYIIVQELIPPG